MDELCFRNSLNLGDVPNAPPLAHPSLSFRNSLNLDLNNNMNINNQTPFNPPPQISPFPNDFSCFSNSIQPQRSLRTKISLSNNNPVPNNSDTSQRKTLDLPPPPTPNLIDLEKKKDYKNLNNCLFLDRNMRNRLDIPSQPEKNC